jgi:hypothetical protein
MDGMILSPLQGFFNTYLALGYNLFIPSGFYSSFLPSYNRDEH